MLLGKQRWTLWIHDCMLRRHLVLEGQDAGPAGSSEKNEMFVDLQMCLSSLCCGAEDFKETSGGKHDLGLKYT